MEGLSRLVGSGCGVWFDGATRWMEALRLRDLGTIEQRILYDRPTNPVRDVQRVRTDPATREAIVRGAKRYLRGHRDRRIVTFEEITAYIGTQAGVELSLWLCFRHLYDTLEAVRAAIGRTPETAMGEVLRMRDQLSGFDLLSSCDWPDALEGVLPERRERRKKILGKQRTPWRRIIVQIAEALHWTPEQVGGLTFYALQTLGTDREALGIKKETADG